MRKTTVLATLAATIALLVSPSAGAIVYGQFDGNLHPNVGHMVVFSPSRQQYVSFCSGTLISPTIFMTASHCTSAIDGPPWNSEVFVSFDPVFTQKSKRVPGTAVTNPNYNDFQGQGGRSDPGDIAVVVLDRPVRDITPAQLPTAGLLDRLKASGELQSSVFTAVGYGTVRETRTGGSASILDNNERRYALQSYQSLTAAWLNLAMNEATGNGGTCYGDSGGPHFLGDETSNLVVSITVTGDAVCKATDTTYRVDTEAARSFLSAYVSLP